MKTPWLPATLALLAVTFAAAALLAPFVVPLAYALTLGGDTTSALTLVLSAAEDYPACLASVFSEPYLATTALFLLASSLIAMIASMAGRARLAWERRPDRTVPLENSKVHAGAALAARLATSTWDPRRPPNRTGLALGNILGRQVVWPYVHSVIISESGGGKSRTAVMPSAALLMESEERPTLLFTDPSLELHAYLSPLAERRGYETVVVDFQRPGSSDRFDFLMTIKERLREGDVGEAQKAAESLGAMLSPSDGGDNAIFERVAQQIISAVAFAVCWDESIPDDARSMATVAATVRELTADGNEGLQEWIRGYGPDSPVAALCPSLLASEGKELAAFVVNAHESLSSFGTEGMRHVTRPGDGALGAPCVPRGDGRPKAIFVKTLNPGEKDNRLVALMLRQIWSEVERQGEDRARIRPMHLFLDEYSSISKLDWGVRGCVQKARKYGMHVCFIVQDVDGLAPGDEATVSTILGNCSTIALFGTSDRRTAEHFEALFGRKAVLSKTTGSASSEEELLSVSQGYSEQSVPNFTVGQLLERDASRDGVLVFNKSRGGGRLTGRFVVPVKDVSRTKVGRLLGTVGSREFEADVLHRAYEELSDRKRNVAPAETWTPRRGPEAQKAGSKNRIKLKLDPGPSSESPGSLNADRFSL